MSALGSSMYRYSKLLWILKPFLFNYLKMNSFKYNLGIFVPLLLTDSRWTRCDRKEGKGMQQGSSAGLKVAALPCMVVVSASKQQFQYSYIKII